MHQSYFPVGTLNSPDVAPLSADHKMLLAGYFFSRDTAACGIIPLTDATIAKFSLLPAVGIGIAHDFARRGQAVFNEETREFFYCGFFQTNLTPAEAGVDSPWARAVLSSLVKVRCPKVKEAAEREMEKEYLLKAARIPGPTNLLTALPRRQGGGKWTASELLVLVALFVDQDGPAPGIVCRDDDVTGALCSLPPMTVAKCYETLQAGGAIQTDGETGETLVFARLKSATEKGKKDLEIAVPELISTTLKRAAKRILKTRFPEMFQKSMACVPKERSKQKKTEEKVEDKTGGADAPAATAVSNQSTSTSRPPRPGSCASGALSVQEGMALNDALDLLRQNGERKGGDLEWDRGTINKIRDLAAWIGDEREVVAAMAGERYPTAALKACITAGLQARAEGEEKRQHVAEAEAKEALWQAKVAAAQPEIDPAATEKGVELLAAIRQQRQARQQAA